VNFEGPLVEEEMII
jgi:hypothetical protein